MLERGADQVTAVNVAERADVARTTIYRHWPDQASLLLATIDDFGTPTFEPSMEGDLEVDLRDSVAKLAQRLAARKTRLVFSALATHAHHSETFAVAQQNFVRHLANPIQMVLEASIERGDLASTCDCEFEASLLAAPILHQHFMLYGELSADLVNAVVDSWLEARR